MMLFGWSDAMKNLQRRFTKLRCQYGLYRASWRTIQPQAAFSYCWMY